MMDHGSLIARLQNEIGLRLGAIPTDAPFALLDFPDHPNVGDSAIWAGEIAYFREVRRTRPAYVCSFRNFDSEVMTAACPEGTIFIHGGGNFGDIWLHHHAFRMRVFEQFKGRKIVQLPQSIHFSSEDRIAETARAIDRHGDVSLFVRDAESLDFARRRFQCEVMLCPDMAFCIGPLPKGRPQHEVVILQRTDHERAKDAAAVEAEPGVHVADWIEENVNLVRLSKAVGYAKGFPDVLRGRREAYDLASWRRIRRGLGLLSSGETVITDRLHAHILSLLMGVPHALLDNSYGKIDRFRRAWTLEAAIAVRAETYQEALSWCRARGASA